MTNYDSKEDQFDLVLNQQSIIKAKNDRSKNYHQSLVNNSNNFLLTKYHNFVKICKENLLQKHGKG